ncbi:MetQ/NlpA family ABC transporter substrate-binding protein [Paenibacillus sp. NPDC058071]|uniref:MetQ/NlpA family ABC transporter substrate-binding protein n=1 Tax=Paenibacillus sp. NPDC058071 TaxID=3346326 RepID=UPI0036D8ABA3
MKKSAFAILLSIMTLILISACGTQAPNAGNTAPAANTQSENETGNKNSDSNKEAGSNDKPEDHVIKLLANSSNHNDEVAAILVKEVEKLGYKLEFKVPTDIIIANKEVVEGNYDVVIGNHSAALKAFNEGNNANLVPAFLTTFAPNGIYSKKYASFKDLPDGATIGIPGDTGNGGRPLLIMQNTGLIKLKEGLDVTKITTSDIVENPHNFKFKTLETGLLLRALDDLDAGFLFQSQRVQGGLKLEDAFGLESAEVKDFYIIAATRPELADSPKIEALKKAYYSDAVKEFYKTRFDEGSIYYAW